MDNSKVNIFDWVNAICHDCGAKVGELHDFGCDMEICPFCGRQLITCGCCYEKLGINCDEGTWTYNHGLTGIQTNTWFEILENKGRIPYIPQHYSCSLCGVLFPDMFTVDDEEWAKYVIPELQDTVICFSCYDKLKAILPNGWNCETHALKT